MSLTLKETIEQADELYAKREQIGAVLESVDLLTAAASQQKDYGIDWRLGRAYFFLGQEARDRNAAGELHQKGSAAAERAAVLEDGLVEGHFWLGVNLALAAALASPFSAISLVKKAGHELKRSVEIDESYHDAGPLRVLARLTHKTPAMIGGSKSNARSYYERAVEIAPNNTVTRTLFAKLLLELGERELARHHLEYVLGVPADAEWAFEIERDKRFAGNLLKQDLQNDVAEAQ